MLIKVKLYTIEANVNKKSQFKFHLGMSNLDIVSSYKYLGITLNEFLEFQSCAMELSEAGGRAFGGIISKFKTF